MQIDDEINVSFSPTNCEILGVFSDKIHLIGCKEIDEWSGCILIIPKEEYLRIIGLYVEQKQTICTSYGHYCGVMESARTNDIKQLESISLNRWSELYEDYEEVSFEVFEATNFDDNLDFEHG